MLEIIGEVWGYGVGLLSLTGFDRKLEVWG